MAAAAAVNALLHLLSSPCSSSVLSVPLWFVLIGNQAMIIVLKPNSTDAQVDHVIERIQELGFKPHLSRGEHRTIIGVIGDENKLQAEPLQAIEGVEQVLPVMKPFKLASREMRKADSVVVV